MLRNNKYRLLLPKPVVHTTVTDKEAPGAFEPSHHCSRRCGGIFCYSTGQFHYRGRCGSPTGRSPGVTHSLKHLGSGP
eukprot:jgi/Botrbrau1/3153/Bobra.0070s0119.1